MTDIYKKKFLIRPVKDISLKFIEISSDSTVPL
jgi:hypothetical protein